MNSGKVLVSMEGLWAARIPGGRWRFSRYDRHAFGHRIESMDLSGRTTFTVKQSNGSGGLTSSRVYQEQTGLQP